MQLFEREIAAIMSSVVLRSSGLCAPTIEEVCEVRLLGHDAPLEWETKEDAVRILTPHTSPDIEGVRHAYVSRLSGAG